MTPSIYDRLADLLNAIPNGYPRTESGVEIRILEKLFTPEEAALALHLRLIPARHTEIAERAGLPPAETRARLKEMAVNGLIGTMKVEGGLGYHLLPFVVGFYEFNLHRLDEELAHLVEDYLQETRGGALFSAEPSVHRVIPVQESLDSSLVISPHDEAAALVKKAKSWAVRDCICRVQQNLIGKGCDHPVEACLSFSPIPGWFDADPESRVLTLDEAIDLLREAEEAGLVHTVGNHRDGHFYICNCCTCSCGILRGIAEFAMPAAVARSDYRAVVDERVCSGCEDCITWCQFEAISMQNMVAAVDYARCVGCGQCVTRCSTGALRLEKRPDSEREHLPANLAEWMLERARSRGIDIQDVL